MSTLKLSEEVIKSMNKNEKQIGFKHANLRNKEQLKYKSNLKKHYVFWKFQRNFKIRQEIIKEADHNRTNIVCDQ